MSLLVLDKSKRTKLENQHYEETSSDWPKHLPKPSDDDLKFLAQMSDTNTDSAFFNNKKRSD